MRAMAFPRPHPGQLQQPTLGSEGSGTSNPAIPGNSWRASWAYKHLLKVTAVVRRSLGGKCTGCPAACKAGRERLGSGLEDIILPRGRPPSTAPLSIPNLALTHSHP